MPPRDRQDLTEKSFVCCMNTHSSVAVIKALTVIAMRWKVLLLTPSIKYIDQIDDKYEQMDKADKDSVWYKPTEKAKEYRAFEREMRNKMYAEIAERCGEYDRKHKNRDLER